MNNNEKPTQNQAGFMKAAIKEALKAAAIDEVPIGAVVVKDGKIIARAFNKRELNNDPAGHAEIIALRKAAKKLKSWRLPGCSIYVTLEPCAMCAGAILQARIAQVIFGANDPKGGALGGSFNLYQQPGLNHYPEVIAGVEQEATSRLLTEYFHKKRNQTKNYNK